MNPLVSLIPLAVLTTGFVLRRDRYRHVPAVVLAMVLDLGIILYLEASRHVVDKIQRPMHPMLKVHVSFAALALLGYTTNVVTGIMLWRGTGSPRIHRTMGFLTLVLRSLVSATAFFAVKP